MVTILGKHVKDTATSTHGYRDVAVQSGLVYATKIARPHPVDVYDSSTWRRLREIPTPCCSAEDLSGHTLEITDDRILLCCFRKGKLHVLSHSGELLHTHGRSRREATKVDIVGQTMSGQPVYGPGVLQWPRLCQVDDEGSVLVADCWNDRLQVMRADGTWRVVDLDQPVSDPRGVALCKASLYVAGKYNIARFS